MTKQNLKNPSKTPQNNFKKLINKNITANNAGIRSIKLMKITGDYKLGYIYDKIKSHK